MPFLALLQKCSWQVTCRPKNFKLYSFSLVSKSFLENRFKDKYSELKKKSREFTFIMFESKITGSSYCRQPGQKLGSKKLLAILWPFK